VPASISLQVCVILTWWSTVTHVHNITSFSSISNYSTVESDCLWWFIMVLDSICCFMHILSHIDCGLIGNNDEKYKCKRKVSKLTI